MVQPSLSQGWAIEHSSGRLGPSLCSLSGMRIGHKELTFLKIKLEIERRFLSLEAHQASHTQARVRSLLLQHKPSTSYLLKCCGTLATSQSLWMERLLYSL